MRRRDVLIRLGLIGAAGAGLFWVRDNVIWGGPTVSLPPDGTTGWLDWARPRLASPTVRATVNGREVLALVDSGAQYSVIDRSLFQDLGLTRTFDVPLVAFGVGGGGQTGRGVTVDVAVGPMRLSGLRAAVLDLGPLARAEGVGSPLILGQDVMRAAMLALDTPGRRLAFTAHEVHRPDPDMAEVSVRLERGALMVEVSVEGAVLEAVVDTGASALLALSRESAQGAGLLDGRPFREGASLVLGGAISARIVTARTLTVGDRLYRDAEVAIYGDAPLPGYPRALLGMEAFRDRRLALDLKAGRLWVSQSMDVRLARPR